MKEEDFSTEVDYAAEMLSKAPSGEHFLYTNMSQALQGFESAVMGNIAVNVDPVADEPESCDVFQMRAQALCEMMAEPGHEADYLDWLANVSVPEVTHLVVPNESRAEVVVSASEDFSDSLAVQRLALDVPAGRNGDVVLRIGAGDGLLVQTKVNVADGASLRMVVLQMEDNTKRLFSKTSFSLGQNSSAEVYFVNLHPQLARNEVSVNLFGEGADLRMGGVYTVANGEKVDNVSLVRHNVGHCNSDQLFKGIADDGGVMAFSGLIVVAPDAQKTSASQTNRHMLAHVGARAYAKPQLEIYADDVKCSHGATTGQIDQQQLFYMMQRGIDEATARQLLSAAFVGEVVDRIPFEDVRTEVAEVLLK